MLFRSRVRVKALDACVKSLLYSIFSLRTIEVEKEEMFTCSQCIPATEMTRREELQSWDETGMIWSPSLFVIKESGERGTTGIRHKTGKNSRTFRRFELN